MFDFIDTAIPENSIGAIHQVIATLRRTRARPTESQRPIYDATLGAIEAAEGCALEDLSWPRRGWYITQLESKQRRISERKAPVDQNLGQRLLDEFRKQHKFP